MDIQAYDPDGGSVYFSQPYFLPPGLAATDLGNGTLQISGTIEYTAASLSDPAHVYTIQVYASDGVDPSSMISFSWTVNNVNRAPVITSVGSEDDWNLFEGDTVGIQIAASDPDGDPVNYSAINLPPGLSISYSGWISGTVEGNDQPNGVEEYEIEIIASDGDEDDSAFLSGTVRSVRVATVTLTGPGTVGLGGGVFTVTITGTGASPTGRDFIYFSAMDNDEWDTDDTLQGRTRVFVTGAGAAGTWSVTQTFRLSSNTSSEVVGVDGGSWETTCLVYILVEGPGGGDLAQSTTLTVTATGAP